jgi:catechol 2,3-dioxygenase-like lactoylglutathione lyase family enzyme
MITGLDHVAIAVKDFAAAVDQYTLLLGSPPSAASEMPGQRAALFALSNTRIVLMEADTHLDGVEALGLAVASGERAVTQLEAAGIIGTRKHDHHPAELDPGDRAQLWALPQDKSRQLKLRLVERSSPALPVASSFGTAQVEALDHVVIRSAAPDESVALYNRALGIRLALDRMLGDVRMLFFRTAGVTLEVIADASAGSSDSFFGVAYRVRDLHATYLQLTAAGFIVTEPRVGRKPGTHVFSVRSATCGVPTLFIRDASRD